METIVGTAIILTSLAGIVTSFALLWTKIIKPLFKFFRRIGIVVDVVQELPEWQKSVDDCLSELRPNGGGSMRDKVNNIQTLVKSHIEDDNLHKSGPPTNKVV